MGRHFLYFVRHGQQARPDQPPDVLGNPLTALGRRQARRVAGLLARELAEAPRVVIHHSTMRRAAETAAYVAARLPAARVRPAKDLWEIPAVTVPAQFAQWFTRYSPEQVARGRVQAAQAYQRLFRPVRGRDRHSVVVCHGNVIRYCLVRALDLPEDTWLGFDTTNAGLTVFAIEADGRRHLLRYNDVGHLPPNLRTFI